MYSINYSRQATKFLLKAPLDVVDVIDWKIKNELALNPYSKYLDIKKLKSYKNRYRLRIGVYRVHYEIVKNELIIYIIKISHRKDAY